MAAKKTSKRTSSARKATAKSTKPKRAGAAAARKKAPARTSAKRTPRKVSAKKKAAPKNSLVANINRRKKAGKSRAKAASTVSREAYADMEAGWPGKKGASKAKKRRK